MTKKHSETVSYNETDVKDENRTARPIPEIRIGRRIATVADRLGTRKYAAHAAGISADSLQRYIRDDNMPAFDVAARLCVAANVRMEWLATGEGPMMRNQPQPSAPGYASKPAPDKDSQNVREPRAPMDMGLLTAAARITDEVLRDYDVRDRVNAEGFAELVHVVYQDMAHGRAEDAASEALSRILAITRTPQD